MRIRFALATAALVLCPLAAVAQQPAVAEGVTAVAPGKFAGLLEAKVTLAVESIDKVISTNIHTRQAGRIRMSHLGRSGFRSSLDSTACIAFLATVTPFS